MSLNLYLRKDTRTSRQRARARRRAFVLTCIHYTLLVLICFVGTTAAICLLIHPWLEPLDLLPLWKQVITWQPIPRP